MVDFWREGDFIGVVGLRVWCVLRGWWYVLEILDMKIGVGGFVEWLDGMIWWRRGEGY